MIQSFENHNADEIESEELMKSFREKLMEIKKIKNDLVLKFIVDVDEIEEIMENELCEYEIGALILSNESNDEVVTKIVSFKTEEDLKKMKDSECGEFDNCEYQDSFMLPRSMRAHDEIFKFKNGI